MRYVFPLSALISGKNLGLEISLKLSWKRQFVLKINFLARQVAAEEFEYRRMYHVRDGASASIS